MFQGSLQFILNCVTWMSLWGKTSAILELCKSFESFSRHPDRVNADKLNAQVDVQLLKNVWSCT